MITKADLVNILTKESTPPVIIFGAGTAGQVLYYACQQEGIEIESFCDDSIEKKGREMCGKPVHHTQEIKEKYPDAHFVIAAAEIHDMIDNLSGVGYSKSNLHPAAPFLRGYDMSKTPVFQRHNKEDSDAGFLKFAVESTILCQEGFLHPERVFMRSVDIVITEKCSLKCADCSNLMQFFEKPVNYKIEDMIEAIDLICSYAHEIHEFRVIGGEPFMNKDIHLVIESLINKPNVKRIAIYTNGTIYPREYQIDCLKNEKVIFMITDYSGVWGDDAPNKKTANLVKSKKNVDRLEELCKKENIDYRRHPPENWTDCGRVESFNRTEEENKEVFKSCCCKNLITLSEGELHRCPFSAQITRLGVGNFKDDYVNIMEDLPLDEMRKNLRSLLFERDTLEACDLCPGRRLSDPRIKPAVQVKKVLPIIL